ncbi:MAG TPA: VOC family protein [Anaerolineae bacterium]|jgi:hypothetical protein
MTTFTKTKPAGTPTWFDLMTTDLAKAKDFYAKLFGWTYLDSGPEFGNYAIAQLKGHTVAGIGPMPPGQTMPSVWSVYLATDDIKADGEKIKKLGGKLMMEPMQIAEQGSMAMAVDPTGAVFGLWQGGLNIGAAIAAEPGSMAWQEVITRDAVKARDFYSALYGFTWEQMPGMEYYVLNRGTENMAGVMQMDKTWPAEMPPFWSAYFSVASADDTAKLVTKLGGQVRAEPFDSPYGRIAVLVDPFGATFTVVDMSKVQQ